MSINCNEILFDLRPHNVTEKLYPHDTLTLSTKFQPIHDKQNILNTCPDEDGFDQENMKKKN